ncbi:MAG: homocysteine S-methyltransferase family protein [Microthrixaceae bacterium]
MDTNSTDTPTTRTARPVEPARPLPLRSDRSWFLTDGGLETVLVFHDGLELPAFAAFPLLETGEGRDRLARYYADYLAIAAATGAGFVLETPTWRANPDWGRELGYSPDRLSELNREAVAFLADMRDHVGDPSILISGCIGPRGDGYVPDATMTAREASDYHSLQVHAFAAAGADMVTGMTITTVGEAAGIAIAAVRAGLPSVISFTVETDGRLPTGEDLRTAIEATDDATGAAPAYYMVNCAHPTHFTDALAEGGAWIGRIGAVRANASLMSHAELDEATELDSGDPTDLGRHYRELARLLPNLRVIGGCCGTDHRHVDAIARELLAGRA